MADVMIKLQILALGVSSRVDCVQLRVLLILHGKNLCGNNYTEIKLKYARTRVGKIL